MDGAMSVNLWSNYLLMGMAVFPPCYLTWGQIMVQVMKTMATSFRRPHAGIAALVPPPCSRSPLTHAFTRDSWTLMGKSLSISYGVTAPFSWVLVCTRFSLCPLRVCFSVLCKFWHFYGEVNGNLLQEGLFHTQVYCTQSLFPWNSSLLTYTSTGDHALMSIQYKNFSHIYFLY